ncbi:MAG: hypothetical protein RBT74_17730, partial [Tenuifilaceae bacterium]|nr:hypothetical protein [Tenuifilaceae bacterium]
KFAFFVLVLRYAIPLARLIVPGVLRYPVKKSTLYACRHLALPHRLLVNLQQVVYALLPALT